MKINTTLAVKTGRVLYGRQRVSRLAGHRFWFGFLTIRPKAFQRLAKLSVFLALQHHLWCNLLADWRRGEEANRTNRKRSMEFLERRSRYFTARDCLWFSTFRDRAGIKFYIMTCLDLTTVVSIREEF